jgi:hypothetical protein
MEGSTQGGGGQGGVDQRPAGGLDLRPSFPAGLRNGLNNHPRRSLPSMRIC